MTTTFNLNVTGIDATKFDTLICHIDVKKIDEKTVAYLLDKLQNLYPMKNIIAVAEGVKFQGLTSVDEPSSKVLIQCKPVKDMQLSCENKDCEHAQAEDSELCPHHVFKKEHFG